MFEIDRTPLIQEAIKKAYEDLGSRTIASPEGFKKTFYIKNKAVWLKEYDTDGRAWADNRVYKVDTDKPYVRWMGSYWYLTDTEELRIIKKLLQEIA